VRVYNGDMETHAPVQIDLPYLKADPSGALFKSAVSAEFKVTAAEGIVEGYAATWDRDLGGDRFEKGAFRDIIKADFPQNRIKIYREHRQAIGLPVELKEDGEGLFVRAEIVPGDTVDGDETLNLADRKVYDAFSVCWVPDRKTLRIENNGGERTRVIPKVAALPHIGILADPMNPQAVVTAVKSVEPIEILERLDKIEALIKPADPVQLKTLWDLVAGVDALAVLEGIRQWGELTEDEAAMARELIDHLVSITEEAEKRLPSCRQEIPPGLTGLLAKMSDYANDLRN